MKPLKTTDGAAGSGRVSARLLLALLAAAIIVSVLGILSKRFHQESAESSDVAANPAASAHETRSTSTARASSLRREHGTDARQTAEEIVASKLIKFGKNRREVFHGLAKRFNVQVPDDVERFFEAVESGRWEEIDAAHKALLQSEKELNQPRSAELHQIWRPIQETWGAAREAHNWPAQRLLDYGNAILDSLRPGMIYSGGTDPGCFIATMLNDTSDGEQHVVLTQNALADSTYLKYLDFLYHDRMTTLTEEDSQRAFQEYLADAQKRLQHDMQFPDEPKQIKPGEDIKMTEGRVQVSGQVAVMSINERLFQTLMDKNPDASFAMEESFPFSSMYGSAAPLGPVMELRVQDAQGGLTSEQAAQSVDYWRTAAQQLLSDPETPEGSDARKAYSKLVSSQGGLLLDRKFNTEAEQAFRIATEICPDSPEAVFRYTNLLLAQNRAVEALPIVEGAMRAAPDNKQFQDLLRRLRSFKAN